MKYAKLLTQKEILRLLKWRHYTVNTASGDVYSATGELIIPFEDSNGYQFVRLYWNKKRKTISVSKLVWMDMARQIVPPHFEIHHMDENTRNNNWKNLICIHEIDHDKYHDDAKRLSIGA